MSQPEQLHLEFERTTVGVIGDLEPYEAQPPIVRLMASHGQLERRTQRSLQEPVHRRFRSLPPTHHARRGPLRRPPPRLQPLRLRPGRDALRILRKDTAARPTRIMAGRMGRLQRGEGLRCAQPRRPRLHLHL